MKDLWELYVTKFLNELNMEVDTIAYVSTEKLRTIAGKANGDPYGRKPLNVEITIVINEIEKDGRYKFIAQNGEYLALTRLRM